MNLLFLGDVTGPEAVQCLVEELPGLRRDYAADLVVANADNVAVTGSKPMGGSGMTLELVERLVDGGVDVVSSGTHAWDGSESEQVFAHPKVIRAYNLPPGEPGRGIIELEVAGGQLTLLNLTNTPLVPEALPVWESWLAAPKAGMVLVHFVGAPHEARVFAHAVDGEAAAVLGTLGHEATLHHYLLDGGTALVPDVGMVGPLGGVGGFEARHFVAGLQGEDASRLESYGFVEDPMILDAVCLRIEGGETEEIERVSLQKEKEQT